MVNILVHEGCCESSETDVLGSETHHESSERIRDLIKNKPTISAAEIAMEIDMSSRGVEKQIKNSERQESSSSLVLTLVAIGKS